MLSRFWGSHHLANISIAGIGKNEMGIEEERK